MTKILFVPLQLSLGTVTCLYATPLLAQVTSDGTVNTQVNQNGNVAEITGGETRDSNLFHSFQDFSVPTGNEAFFDNANSISNIFSRVTGGNISNIDGLIRANGSASLFLINPAGIVFGESARLNIGGSFYGSTASSILFEDGEFSAVDNLEQPILTVNAPIGLSFRDNPGDIVNNSIANDGNGLAVNTGQNLALLGGNITFNGGNIFVPGGRVELGGLADEGVIRFDENGNLDFAEDIAKGNVSLDQGAEIDVTSGNGGFITINANNLEILNGSAIIAGIGEGLGSPQSQAGDITLNVFDTLRLQADANTSNSRIANLLNIEGIGNAGDIIIDTTTLEGNSNFSIGSAAVGQGNAGQVIINASEKVSLVGSEGSSDGIISLFASTTPGNSNDIVINTSSLSLSNTQITTSAVGQGNAGDIQVNASESISLSGDSNLQAQTFGQGNGGNISISTANLSLLEGSQVNASTFGQGDAGAITINASGTISADGENSEAFPSGIFSAVGETAVGNSGGVNITTTDLTLTKGGLVTASTLGQGDAGAVTINASGSIFANGENSEGFASAIGSTVDEETAVGNSGEVNITTTDLTLTQGGAVNGSTFGEGDAGAIIINASGTISADGELSNGVASGIFSAVGETAIGSSGGVNITTTDLTLTQGGVVNASTLGQGDAGAVTINASGSISANGERSNGFTSGIFSGVDETAVGNSGGIDINTTDLTLTQGGRVSASTFGQGNAGAVTINASGTIFAEGEDSEGDRSGITSLVNSDAEGDSGGVTISTNNLNLNNGGRVAATTFGTGNAGAVNITATGDITAEGENSEAFPSGITSLVDSDAEGDSGSVTIFTNNLNLNNGGRVSADTFSTGNAGAVNITATGDITAEGENSEAFPSGITSLVNSDAQGDSGGVTISTNNLNLNNGGRVAATTFGTGNAGAVNITATGDITADGENSEAFQSGITSLVNSDAQGDSGGVTISTNNLNLNNGGRIAASTLGTGNAGAVNITATGDITADGENSEAFPSGIYSIVGELAVGNSDKINITTTDLTLTQGGLVTASTLGQGNAGAVTINASGTISADGENSEGFASAIGSTVEELAVGNSGEVNITTTDLTLTQGGAVNGSTFGEGDAGAITINASGTISADGELSNGFVSAIFSAVDEEAVGNSGGVNINSDNLSLSNNAAISASSFGEGNASDLTINTNSLSLDSEASLSATTPIGTGGNINLEIADRLTLDENNTISAQAFNDANGGNININSKFIIASPNQNNDIIASAENGSGGRISLTADGVFGLVERESNPPNETNDLDASSEVGLDGEVSITILESSLFQEVVETPNIVSSQQTVTQACRANREALAQGSFAISGKGGIPPEPGLPLSSSSIYVDGSNNSTSSLPVPIQTAQGKIQPARGIKVTESGKVILTAYRTNNAGERLPQIKKNCG